MNKIKVLIDKTIDDEAVALLSPYADVEVIDTTTANQEKLADADVLCVRTNTNINREYLQNAKQIKIIATATTGTNHIDIDYVCNNGIELIDAKGANADSVADYVFRILFQVTDDAYYTNRLLKEKPELFLKLKKENIRRELGSLSIGIIGLGNIGKRVARRAMAFGMTVKAYDPYVTDAKNTLDEVLRCDVVSIHAELTDETRGMIDVEELSLLKGDVILINAARSEIINEDALIQILNKNEHMHFIVDVFSDEPKPSAFYNLINCTVTPHIAGNAQEAKIRAARVIAEKIILLLEKEKELSRKLLVTPMISSISSRF